MKLKENIYIYPERGFLDCNTYLLLDKLSILIDPGRKRGLLEEIKDDGIDPSEISLILHTHLHIDHYGSSRRISAKNGKLALHPLQRKYFGIAKKVSLFFGLSSILGESFDTKFSIGDEIKTGKDRINVIPTPGHSPESICFYSPGRKFLVCGDLIFQESVGRVDLPGGSGEELKRSVEKVSSLDIELLLPGHMGVINGKEKVIRNFDYIKKFYFDLL